ncbi:DUF1491 family protein [Novosphingobium sp. FSY-8]|uniref:DUF1491 family protein n=1 Tax=Novosphingobium ovatum TaxID=1908523 RepID=A0ABW9XHF7_9SPHN|nr:DUF1491 family protein [Novosphingobium ovatum]NBC37983.1 DUF1491 family protein [Novosphingobium ovatum]
MSRLPTHIEVNALIRRVQAEGGFAMVLAKGEVDAGSILIVTLVNQTYAFAYEKMPSLDGERHWHRARSFDADQPDSFEQWLNKRRSSDPDLWIIELDIADAERFIGYDGKS